jgi:hypothetical protein
MTVYEIKGNDAIEKIKKVLNRYGISDPDTNGINLVEAEFKKGTERAITLEDVSRQTYFPIYIIKEIEILLLLKIIDFYNILRLYSRSDDILFYCKIVSTYHIHICRFS